MFGVCVHTSSQGCQETLVVHWAPSYPLFDLRSFCERFRLAAAHRACEWQMQVPKASGSARCYRGCSRSAGTCGALGTRLSLMLVRQSFGSPGPRREAYTPAQNLQRWGHWARGRGMFERARGVDSELLRPWWPGAKPPHSARRDRSIERVGVEEYRSGRARVGQGETTVSDPLLRSHAK